MSIIIQGQEAIEINPDGSPVEQPEPIQLEDDVWVAAQLKMKVPTIRSERFKRKHGLKHWFTVDPVFIGSKPRYRRMAVIAWLERQYSKSMSSTPPASGNPDVGE
jgi:hypothetical protein